VALLICVSVAAYRFFERPKEKWRDTLDGCHLGRAQGFW